MIQRYAGFVDRITDGKIIGWVIDTQGHSAVTVECWLDGTKIGNAIADQPRPDVKKVGHPTERCGFQVLVPSGLLVGRENEIRIVPVGSEQPLAWSRPLRKHPRDLSGGDFPPEFDPQFYRARHPDLRGLSETELAAHFESSGKKEGRVATRAAQRPEFLKIVSHCASVLEIGPFYKPAVTGAHVSYFDVLDTEALKKRATSLGYSTEHVPHVAYVDPRGDLSIVDRKFDAVISSHCIEHQPDLIRHLQQVAALLLPGGKYFLLIPDKRYCFDHFIAESTVADVIDAHVAARRLHSLGSVVKTRALSTHNDPIRHWKDDHANPGYHDTIAKRTRAALAEYNANPDTYIDVHAWQFTPDSFFGLCEQLGELGYSNLWPVRVYQTERGSNEFAAILALGSE